MKLSRGTLLFLIGLALGAVLAVIGPRVAGPYLPEALRGKVEFVEAEVTRKPPPRICHPYPLRRLGVVT